MGRGRLFLVTVCLSACLTADVRLHAAAPSAPAETPALSRSLRVVMDDNYPPYVFLDGKGTLQGILIDRWRLWERKTGIRVEIHAMDWAEALRRMVAEELVRERPGIKVLYMSGYTADALGGQGILAEGMELIEKPFTPAELAGKVRKILCA